jgi:hypothetical protein
LGGGRSKIAGLGYIMQKIVGNHGMELGRDKLEKSKKVEGAGLDAATERGTVVGKGSIGSVAMATGGGGGGTGSGVAATAEK